MESMSKSEFVKKLLNDRYNKKIKEKNILNEIKAYEYKKMGKSLFKSH